MIEFTNKTVVVTGGGSGIGFACARAFASAGATVVLAGRRAEVLENAATTLNDELGRECAIAIPADVTDESAVANLFVTAVERTGRVDVLINSHGTGGSGNFLVDMDAATFRATLDTNLTGVFLAMRGALNQMREQSAGVIVNIASMAGRRISNSGMGDYVASKHGVVGLTMQAAAEAAQWNTRVVAICPGTVLTEMIQIARGQNAGEKLAKEIPLGEVALPEDVANLALFLASDLAGKITGTAIDIDGGQWLPVHTDYAKWVRRRNLMNQM
ncbi:MAG: SDR family oxidoreductase [Phycisphaerales bacterium]|jgi:NAD(P)-dependent dehydrogenase (short-subunit alcohol dehydrogenase family)|nr:SDR family oxidoreductase [Phycisphaerales bacterium]MBT7171307.1 SDR family oxidoreductase [Phycisphaerales bacterium]